MAGASRIWKFVKSNLPRVYDVDLLGLFLRFFTTSFELRAVDHSVFCHLSPRPAPPAPQSLSHNLRRHQSRRPARGCVSYVLCPAWWASMWCGLYQVGYRKCRITCRNFSIIIRIFNRAYNIILDLWIRHYLWHFRQIGHVLRSRTTRRPPCVIRRIFDMV